MPNRLLLALAAREDIASIVKNTNVLKPLVKRYIGGETIDEALIMVTDLNSDRLTASLDHLGENTTDAASAQASTHSYSRALQSITDKKVQCNISVKLTALGIDVSWRMAQDNLRLLVAQADDAGNFVRVDMEGSVYTADTLQAIQDVRDAGHDNVGPVIQAYLYRSASDVEKCIATGTRVRLCKGAYSEEPNVAFRRKRDTDRNYVALMERLLLAGVYPAIATHDESIIEHAKDFVMSRGFLQDRFEFQMLFGIRRDLQRQLIAEGYNVRIYVPYGTQWYPYLTRRLAERPANVEFILKSLAKERT